MSASPEASERQWALECERAGLRELPASFWRATGDGLPVPTQGWKLHVSATVLTATDTVRVLRSVLRGVHWKAPSSLAHISSLNTGIGVAYSQVGKVFTVYPKTDEQFVRIALELSSLLEGREAPAVPFEPRVRDCAPVFYRYGLFHDPPGAGSVMLTSVGDQEPDVRGPGRAVPTWLADPLLTSRTDRPASRDERSLLGTRFVAYEAIVQRGKGGVYLAIDLAADHPRRCVLKEGRRHGETDQAGRDGFQRVLAEADILRELGMAVPVPAVLDSFTSTPCSYIAMELVQGESLVDRIRFQDPISPPGPVPAAGDALVGRMRLCAAIARAVCQVHSSGWIWRDCKPANIIVTDDESVVLLDFEGACRISAPEVMPWGSPTYVPPEWSGPRPRRAATSDDVYALGVVCLNILSATAIAHPSQHDALLTASRVPERVARVVRAMLAPEAAARPSAEFVADEMGSLTRA